MILAPIPQMGAQVLAVCRSLCKPLVRTRRGFGACGPAMKLPLIEFFSAPSSGPAILIYWKAEDFQFDLCTVCVLDPASLSEFLFNRFPS